MKEKKKETVEDKMDKLTKKFLEVLRVNTICVSTIQFKNTDKIISEKVLNENNSIEYSINSINKNVLKNTKKYSNILKRKDDLLSKYEELLKKIASFYDNHILSENIKILKEELSQLEQYKILIDLKNKEAQAKNKVDNSDDEIAEQIYLLEEVLSKSETKVKRTKTLLRKKIKEKEEALFYAIETKDKGIQKEIKGPRVLKNATRFFIGKINPHKLIEKNVFVPLENRINSYETEAQEKLKKKIKYTEENMIPTIESLIEKTKKNLL